jgi:hypothetical protein
MSRVPEWVGHKMMEMAIDRSRHDRRNRRLPCLLPASCTHTRTSVEGGRRERKVREVEREARQEPTTGSGAEAELVESSDRAVEGAAVDRTFVEAVTRAPHDSHTSVECVRCHMAHFPLQEGLCQVCLRLDMSTPASTKIHSTLKSVEV